MSGHLIGALCLVVIVWVRDGPDIDRVPVNLVLVGEPPILVARIHHLEGDIVEGSYVPEVAAPSGLHIGVVEGVVLHV